MKAPLWCIGASLTIAAGLHADDAVPSNAMFRQYCVACHGKTASGGINIEKLSTERSVADSFRQWERIAAVLDDRRMPPAKAAQPSDTDRGRAAAWIRTRLRDYAKTHDGDPGRVTVRRLTSGEYAYTIKDLTGLDLKFDRGFVDDSVGGEGFANYGDVQFMQDANLERYLGAAKQVANHAVIGSGPLAFFAHPGRSGMELSAIDRIQAIYRTHGFRAASGEGGKAYGLDRYGKALYAAWRYRHRAELGEPKATLESMGVQEGLTPRFMQHIWRVLSKAQPTYPTSEVVERWRKLPVDARAARAGCDAIQKFLIDWPRFLLGAGAAAEGGEGDERALVLTDESVQVSQAGKLGFFTRFGRGQSAAPARVHLSTVSLNPNSADKPVVLWRNPVLRFRRMDRSTAPEQPFLTMIDEASRQRLGLTEPKNGPLEFRTEAGKPLYFDFIPPAGGGAIDFQVEVSLERQQAGDAVVRSTISETADLGRGRPASALLGYPDGSGFKAWKVNVLEFAVNMPQISHGEPTPSDRDPIPPPYNTAYNQPERDSYHVRVKYYRDDRFVVEKMLDDATRSKLDLAWHDLLGSFGYHDAILYFVAEKFKVDLKGKTTGELSAAEIEAMPAEPRKFVQALRAEFDQVQRAMKAAQPGHVEDCVRFAGQAWRRPLTDAERTNLRLFYNHGREILKLDHDKAIRALLARIMVAPAFLYRLEQAPDVSGARPLTGVELASRMSYFLWSSIPDKELTRAATAGELSDPRHIGKQVQRMVADSKARRFATEFFGQWLGFYRFDQFTGADTSRFPEFTDELKSGMYDEAVSFFEHIVRNNRPSREILFADYTFLNQSLANHYGVKKDLPARESKMVADAREFQRGGVLRLGAVLTATSAPLRTSPVKRGDWLLRRVLGTPTPPPPADAGSIPADEKQFGGMSLREKLQAHQRNAACAGCHLRIDPLGFPFERYDAVGRWRDAYSDGKPVNDAATTFDKTNIQGVNGLLDYLKTQEQQIQRTMAQKLIGYALGRTVQASDLLLVERLVSLGGDANFGKLAAEIVTSKQFRYRRPAESGPAQVAANRNTREEQ